MTTATEMTVEEELRGLNAIVEKRTERWKLEIHSPIEFALGLQAKDQSWVWFLVKCDQYPAVPPAWHMYNPANGEIDQPKQTLRFGKFFHSSGVICAPWNRLAYKSEDSRGPHGEWTIGAWKSNPWTKSCRTLAAMALRLYVELQSKAFDNRR